MTSAISSDESDELFVALLVTFVELLVTLVVTFDAAFVMLVTLSRKSESS
jgi:hypothetical protein